MICLYIYHYLRTTYMCSGLVNTTYNGKKRFKKSTTSSEAIRINLSYNQSQSRDHTSNTHLKNSLSTALSHMYAQYAHKASIARIHIWHTHTPKTHTHQQHLYTLSCVDARMLFTRRQPRWHVEALQWISDHRLVHYKSDYFIVDAVMTTLCVCVWLCDYCFMYVCASVHSTLVKRCYDALQLQLLSLLLAVYYNYVFFYAVNYSVLRLRLYCGGTFSNYISTISNVNRSLWFGSTMSVGDVWLMITFETNEAEWVVAAHVVHCCANPFLITSCLLPKAIFLRNLYTF